MVTFTAGLTLASAGTASVATPAWRALQNHDPSRARLVTSDIPNFWRVFDRASLTGAAESFQREYLDRGSPGLHDFLSARIQSSRLLAATVAMRPRYYAAIRNNTLALDTSAAFKDAIHAAFGRLKAFDDEAVFPDVYFVIGRMNSAGTTSSNGLLIGVEMNARDGETPVDELTAWERAVTGLISDLPHIVAHELVHLQQPAPGGTPTLLDQALREGAADFVAELISGGHNNRLQHVYGDAHERELWEEFTKSMNGTDVSHWLYQGDRATDRPADLGYYIGYKICEAYYRREADKSRAVRQILHANGAEEFLRRSGYSGGTPRQK